MSSISSELRNNPSVVTTRFLVLLKRPYSKSNVFKAETGDNLLKGICYVPASSLIDPESWTHKTLTKLAYSQRFWFPPHRTHILWHISFRSPLRMCKELPLGWHHLCSLRQRINDWFVIATSSSYYVANKQSWPTHSSVTRFYTWYMHNLKNNHSVCAPLSVCDVWVTAVKKLTCTADAYID